MSRTQQHQGAVGEQRAEELLQRMGVQMVEQIATPIVITNRNKTGWVKIRYKSKVSGDRRGVMNDGSGRRVLAEVKTTRDRNLRFSDLQPHQVEALNENDALGAVSLLVWVAWFGYRQEITVMRWPVPGFGPRKSIGEEQAEQWAWNGRD